MKNFAFEKTLTTTDFWRDLTEEKKKELINKEIAKDETLREFEVHKVFNDGQIVFHLTKTIPSSIRGTLLLDLEDRLKKNIDIGLTVWLEPVGDKSKLRNLRGIKINS